MADAAAVGSSSDTQPSDGVAGAGGAIAPPPDASSDEQEIVAVGAVAHVVKRAFHQFYRSDGAHDASRTATAADEAHASSSAAALVASTPRQEVAAPAPVGVTDGDDQEHAAISAPPPLEPVNPYVLLGESRKAQIRSELRGKRDDAVALLRFLDERHREAQAADDAVAQELSSKGLVIKAQIPMGPTNLRLEQTEVDAFGAFAHNLVHAAQLVNEYHARRREKSGNGSGSLQKQQSAALGLNAEPLGYLDATESATIRTQSTLKTHQSHIEAIKTHHQQQQSHPGSNESFSHSPDSADGDAGTGGSRNPQEAQFTAPQAKPHAEAVMGAVEKRKNLEILSRMQTKLDFLRNPRYVASEATSGTNGSSHGSSAAGSGKTGDSAAAVSTSCFVVVPSPVEFTDYDIGGVYEQLVYLRNTSQLSRRLRVLPPGTLYFSISEIAFPDPSGLIAPGMHVQIRLRFAPDSRADYKDALQVVYEGANAGQRDELAIPLVAHRTPPELSIPLVLRAQNTLVGTYSITPLACRNNGGKARFWLMTEADWARYEASASQFLSCQDQSSSSASLTRTQVKLGAFTLSPNEMELDTGESMELLLQYVPSCVGEQREKFVMVCDNCLVRVFQVVGRGCQVEVGISAVNDKQVDASIAQIGSVDHVCFEDLLVNARAQQSFVVTNDTPIDLAFTWRIEPLGCDSSTELKPSPLPYEIRPASGVIALNAALEFTVAFLPKQARVYHWKATLLINDIPACSMPGSLQRSLLIDTFQRLSASLSNVVLEAVQCLSLRLDGAGMLGSFSIEPATWNFCQPATAAVLIEGVAGREQQQLLKRHETYTTRVKLVNATLAPVAFEVDTVHVQQLHLKPARSATAAIPINSQSRSAAPLTPSFELTFSPMRGEIAPKAQICVDIVFTPHCVGAFSLAVPICIPTLSSASTATDSDRAKFVRWLLLEGVVAMSQVEILSREVDFGLVLVGASTEAALTFRNPSSVASAEWRFTHLEAAAARTSTAGGMSPDAKRLSVSQATLPSQFTPPVSTARRRESTSQLHRSGSKDSIVSRRSVGSTSSGNDTSRSSNFLFTARDTLPRATVTFVPDTGTLAPGETRTIKVLCLAGSLPERLRASFCCQLAPEPFFSASSCSSSAGVLALTIPRSVSVSARAEIQSPNVFLAPCKLHLGTTYLGVSVHRTLQLVNVSNLEASFKFVEPQGASKAYSVEFSPKSGTIRSKETVTVSLSYTPRQAGKMTVLLACTVRGLTVPLGVEISTNQKGLVLSYELLSLPGTASPPPAVSQLSSYLAQFLPKSPKQIALERGVSIADCDLEPETNPLSAVPKLLFGDAIPLGERRLVHVVVRNFSGIEAVVELEAKKFPAKILTTASNNHSSTSASPSSTSKTPTSSSKATRKTSSPTTSTLSPTTKTRTSTKSSSLSQTSSSSPSTTSRKKLLLADTHEQPNRFQSEPGRDYVRQCAEDLEDREILSRGHGVAFQLQPSHLRIPPWEQAVVTCVCFNNMPGSYTDDIVSRAAGVPPVFLHAQATVVGTPLTLDRNCVGLYHPKKSSLDRQPSFHFGQLSARSPPITRSIRVVNRGPKQARLRWKLVENGRENQLVDVSLRVDFNCRVQLRITACSDGDVEFPFAVHPEQSIVPPFATVPFQITFTPPMVSETLFPRALLLADAFWYDLKTKDDEPSCPELSNPVSTDDHDSLTLDSRCESSSPTHKARTNTSSSTTAAAAGKAIAAVRAANSLARRTMPPGLLDATPSSVSAKCLRVLLGADVIEPELYIDKSVGRNSSLSLITPAAPSLHEPYHIKFTTWSTIAASVSDNAHVFHRKELFLVNHFSTRLTFRLESVGAFLVFRADSCAPKHPLSSAELPPAHRRAQGEAFMFTLPPQMSVRIDLRFDPSQLNSSSPPVALLPGTGAPGFLLSTASTSSSSSSSSLARKQQQENQKRLKLLVEGQLLIKFTNRSVQTVNLVTEILKPLVVVSPSVHFFGHVHLSKTRSVVLRVANPTIVPAAFTIQHVPAPVPLSKAQKHEFNLHHAHFVDDPSVFTFSAMKGVVAGPTKSLQSSGGVSLPSTDSTKDLGPNHLVFEPVEVLVVFKAPATKKRFKSRFRFAVAHGLDFEVVLEGEGHLSEQEVADQDRSIVRTSALEHSHQIFKKIPLR